MILRHLRMPFFIWISFTLSRCIDELQVIFASVIIRELSDFAEGYYYGQRKGKKQSDRGPHS